VDVGLWHPRTSRVSNIFDLQSSSLFNNLHDDPRFDDHVKRSVFRTDRLIAWPYQT